MIRAVVVDDEKPALDKLCLQLARQPDVEVVGAYNSPKKALEELLRLHPDIVFLDIEMPGFSGLEMAEAVKVMSGKSFVVFVTAYSQYALEAFGVEAMDYLVKPVTDERLAQTMKRLKKMHNTDGGESKLPLSRCILTLGILELKDGADTMGINWRTNKTREMFALLVHHRGNPQKKDKIIEWLWPDIESEKGSRMFHTTIHYLRKSIKSIGLTDALQFSNNRYVLNLGQITCDVEEFERLCAQSIIDLGTGSLAVMKRAIGLYRGDYFEEEEYNWAADKKNKLLSLYLNLLMQVSEELIRARNYNEAGEYLELLVRKNPLNEDAQVLLMEVYAEKRDRDRLIKQFEEYKGLLREELGVDPEREVRLHFYQMLKKCFELTPP